MQVTGTLAETPCNPCRRGFGVFEGCVVSDVGGRGACANCFYTCHPYRCNFRNNNKAADALAIPARAEAMPPAAPAQPLLAPTQPFLAPAQPIAVPAQPLDALFLLPPAVPEGVPYFEKRARARWLREMADMYDRSAEDEIQHQYA